MGERDLQLCANVTILPAFPSENIYKGIIVCRRIPFTTPSVPAKRDAEQRSARDVIQNSIEKPTRRAPGVGHVDSAGTVGPCSISIALLIDKSLGDHKKPGISDA
jgi:hypothetical protein